MILIQKKHKHRNKRKPVKYLGKVIGIVPIKSHMSRMAFTFKVKAIKTLQDKDSVP